MSGNLLGWGAVPAACFLLVSRSVEATPITLSEGNTVVNFRTEASDAGGPVGMYDWEVDGKDHLTQQWFWVRVGNTSPEDPISSLTHVYSVASDTGGSDPGLDLLNSRYTGLGLQIDIRYSLLPGAPGSNFSDIGEQIRITNTTAAPLTVTFFQYTDLDLSATPNDDSVAVLGGNTARQTDGSIHANETVVTPMPTSSEAAIFNATLVKLNDGVPSVLDGSVGPLSTANVTWAFQWTVTLEPNRSYSISKDKLIQPIPEPATALLLGAFAIPLLVRRRR